jgi:predicted phosphodiesterase
MEFVTRKTPKNFNIFFIGDTHIGSALFHEKGFRSFIEAVKKPYAGATHNVVIGMGDYIEALDTSDKRFDLDSVDKLKIRPEHQMDFFVEAMSEIKKHIVLLLFGNHEHTLKRYHDYVAYACKQLGTKYGTYSSIVTFMNNKNTLFKAYVTHGRGSFGSVADSPERRKANMALQLKRKLWTLSGDCALMAVGHTHKLLIAEPDRALYIHSDTERVYQAYTSTEQNAEFIPRDHRFYVNTGSLVRLFGRGISGYAERAMYAPMELGYAVVRVRRGRIAGIDKVIV